MATTTLTTEEVVVQYGEMVRQAIDARDRAIVAMRADGASHRQIAAAAGLSHTTVQQILKRVEPRAATTASTGCRR